MELWCNHPQGDFNRLQLSDLVAELDGPFKVKPGGGLFLSPDFGKRALFFLQHQMPLDHLRSHGLLILSGNIQRGIAYAILAFQVGAPLNQQLDGLRIL